MWCSDSIARYMPKKNDCIDLYKILNLNIKIKIIQKIESPDIYQLLNTPMSYIPKLEYSSVMG